MLFRFPFMQLIKRGKDFTKKETRISEREKINKLRIVY